jgi:hypothetical protein
MSATICRFEFDILTDLQKGLHFGEGSEEVTSIFYREFRKTTWYSQHQARLKCTTNDTELIATANNTFHYLLYNYIRQTYPAIRVKPGYRKQIQICWCHNLGTNATPQAGLYFDDSNPQNIDSVWCDIYSQFFMKPGFREHYNVCVGNLPFLEEWNNEIPEWTTNVIHPFYNIVDPSKAIPLFYFSSTSTISYHYTLRTKVDELLRMRYQTREKDKITGEPIWKECPVNFKYLEGVTQNTILKTPEVWGRYAYLSDDEISWFKNCAMQEVYSESITDDHGNTKIVEKIRAKDRTIYIEDVIACDSTNPATFGDNATVELDCKTPAKAAFWVAENLAARANRNYSNYTTNKDDLYKGWNPISKFSFNYAGSPKIDAMDSDHFDKIEAWNHFISPPSEAGYNALAISYDPSTLDADVGIVMNGVKARIIARLGNTDPRVKPLRMKEDEANKAVLDELEENNTNHQKGDNYQIHVRLLVAKKMTISKTGEKSFIVQI